MQSPPKQRRRRRRTASRPPPTPPPTPEPGNLFSPEKRRALIALGRLDRPIGIVLLLWPTLWALWCAAEGVPSIKNLLIFVLGTVLMRTAGCMMNDFADRNIDGGVQRTRGRPLPMRTLAPRDALVAAAGLAVIAFVLVLFTNRLTIALSFVGLLLAVVYPFIKRYTHLPQLWLGVAFGWGIPMAYAAEVNSLPPVAWLLLAANVAWATAYDTMYAMVDRDDDLRLGVKSTAILFGDLDKAFIGVFQVMTLMALAFVAQRLELGWIFFISLLAAAGTFAWQQWLIAHRTREGCFKAFLNNAWTGGMVFAGLALDFAWR